MSKLTYKYAQKYLNQQPSELNFQLRTFLNMQMNCNL
jgi:hypothetical protein